MTGTLNLLSLSGNTLSISFSSLPLSVCLSVCLSHSLSHSLSPICPLYPLSPPSLFVCLSVCRSPIYRLTPSPLPLSLSVCLSVCLFVSICPLSPLSPLQYLLDKVQNVQNAVARLVCKAKKSDHIHPILETLHWLQVTHRIQYKISTICFNSISGTAPQYLSDILQPYTPARQLRSASDTRTFVTPPPPPCKHKNIC